MLGPLVSNYFKSIFFEKSPFTYLDNISNKMNLFPVVILYVLQILVSVILVSVIYIEIITNTAHHGGGEETQGVLFLFILLQCATAVFIVIQTVITYIATKFILKIKLDINKYMISLIYVSGVLMWIWVAVIALQEGSILIFILIYLFFTYRNYTSTRFMLHASKRFAISITTWPFILVLYMFV